MAFATATALTIAAIYAVRATSIITMRTPHRHGSLVNSLTVVAPTDAEPTPPPSEPSVTGAATAVRHRDIAPVGTALHESVEDAVATETPTQAVRRARQVVAVPAEWRRRRSKAFREYSDLHAAILSGSGRTTADGWPRRYLVVQPCCQLCNRVRVLISAVALGMLTGRAVLMDFDGGSGRSSDYYGRFDDLFESPLRVQSTRTPRDLKAGGDERTLQWLETMTDFMCILIP